MKLRQLREIIAENLQGINSACADSIRLSGPTHVRTYGVIYQMTHPDYTFPLAVKRCIDPETGMPDRKSCGRQFRAMQAVHAAMGEAGEFRVTTPVLLIQDEGIIVMGWAPGRPLIDYYMNWRTPLSTLVAETRRAGQWLGRFHRCHSLPRARLDTELHLQSIRNAHAAAPPGVAADHVLIGAVEVLEQTARKAADAALAQSWLHGDFHCANLLVDQNRVTGIDIDLHNSGTCLIDVVIFLNHLDHLLTQPGGLRNFPRRRPIVAAFLDGYGDGVDFTTDKHLAWLYLQRAAKFYFDFCDSASVIHNRHFRFFHRPRIARLIGDLQRARATTSLR